MKRGINILHGVNGYRDQLRRADRFLQKMLTSPEGWEDFDDLEYQDKVWAFFQNCWHIKDWLRNDKDLSTAVQDSVLKAVHHSPTLQICRGLCNGTKHYLLHNDSRIPSHKHLSIEAAPERGVFEVDCIVNDGNGNERSAKELARACMAEWKAILTANDLDVD